jgi:hypothetical protein
MNKREVPCSSCGAINRLSSYSITRKPKCGRCGAALPERAAIRIARGLFRLRSLASLALLISFVFAFPVILRFVDGPSKAERLANFSCPSVAVPANGPITKWNLSQPRVAKISIRADAGMNYVLKAEDADTHLQLVKFFVSGGTTFQTEMPAGRFVLTIASGINWCGRKEMFGPDTITACLTHRSDASGTCSIYPFGPNDTWQIDLVRQVGGNLSTAYVPRDKF